MLTLSNINTLQTMEINVSTYLTKIVILVLVTKEILSVKIIFIIKGKIIAFWKGFQRLAVLVELNYINV